MSTLLTVLKALTGIPKILEFIRYLRGAWLESSHAKTEIENNARNDAIVDELAAGVHDETLPGQHSLPATGPTGPSNGSSTSRSDQKSP